MVVLQEVSLGVDSVATVYRIPHEILSRRLFSQFSILEAQSVCKCGTAVRNALRSAV